MVWALVRRWWRSVVSVVIGGRSADGGGCGAAGAGHGGGQGGRLQRAAVQRTWLERAAGGALALTGTGGRDLKT